VKDDFASDMVVMLRREGGNEWIDRIQIEGSLSNKGGIFVVSQNTAVRAVNKESFELRRMTELEKKMGINGLVGQSDEKRTGNGRCIKNCFG
jgi:hypothetical protein